MMSRGAVSIQYEPKANKWFLVEDMGNRCTRAWRPTVSGGKVRGFDTAMLARSFLKDRV